MTDRSKVIFGNTIAAKDVKKAAASKAKYAKKFGDDADVSYPVRIVPNACLKDLLGVYDVRLEDGEGEAFDAEKGLIFSGQVIGHQHKRN